MNSLVHSREALVPGADLSALIAKLEAGPVYLTHKEAYDLAIWFGSDTALGLASLIRKAFAGGSVDAALALAERVLPGWRWSVVRTEPCEAYVWPPEQAYADIQAKAVTPALAICAAILRAHASRAVEGE